MTKIELIGQITDFHPGYDIAIKGGWSYYVGGIGDHGDWYYRKLLAASEQELQELLNSLIAIRDRVLPELSEEDKIKQSTIILTPYGVTNQLEKEKMESIYRETERKMMWGI